MALLQNNFWPAIFRDDDDVGCGPIVENYSDLSRSAHIASCFLELEKLNEELKSKLRDDFISILNGMDSISLSSTSQALSPSATPPSRPSSLVHDNAFVTEAYSWLLDNIANPYPSSTHKTSLSQRYNCTLSAVNSWFINARRRMGWTALCRDHFNNCRADALDAAHRAFIKEDLNRLLPADIIHAFVSVKATVEELYSSTLTKSAFADVLNVAKEVSDRESVAIHQQECPEPAGTMEFSKASGQGSQPSVAQNCYPSDHSPSSFSVPALDESLTDESEDDEDILPPTLAGRKRRLSSSESRTPTSKSVTRLVKRPRLSPSSSNASPATSTDESSENDPMSRFVPITQNSTRSKVRRKRLSDGDITIPERPQDSIAGPCPHTVSDPLPLSTVDGEQSIDEWFKANFDTLFDLPPPVDVAEPDFSTQLEVELFNKYILPENPQEALVPAIPDYGLSSSADLTSLDDLLKSFGGDGFVAPPEIMYPPTLISAAGTAPQYLPILPDLSQSIDWTALLNGSSEPSGDSIFSQTCVNSILPEIDLSFLQLPQVWTTVAS